jgi:hypothetical protein
VNRNKGEGMVWQRIRIALLVGALAALAAPSARAEEGCCNPAPCAPQFCTIRVTECVPETYQAKRIVYKTVCKEEKYTAFKCVTVPEKRTRTCTVYKTIPEVRTVTRLVSECVPCVEDRVVMKPCYKTVTETHMVKRCVSKGHYECREVPCHRSGFREGLGHLCRRNHDSCCEPCPPPTKTVKVWVPCPVYEDVPVTRCRRVCEYQPEVRKVTTYKHVTREVKSQVTCYRSVPECRTEEYTVLVSRQVPYQATRLVSVCVPHEETVTCTRLVPRVVERQVPVSEAPCCNLCGSGGHRSRGHGGFWNRRSHCCD